MRYLEVRRHTERVKPGQHLSQAGVDLARRVGDTIGPFDRVITTSLPRAYETAIAMGFAVDEIHDRFYDMGDEIPTEIAWDAGFPAWANACRQGGTVTRYCPEVAAYWRSLVSDLLDGGTALLVTHGGIIEAGTVGCLPDADFESLGGYCGYCEGVRMAFDGERFVSVEILRVIASADPS